MRPAWRSAYLLVGVLGLTLLPLTLPAWAATTVWYAGSDSIPSARLTSSAPPDIDLPNHDPDRDAEPGLLLTRTGDGANETNPSKYQQWARDVSGMTLSVQGFHIWAAPEDFVNGKTVELRAYLMACGNGCDVLDSEATTIRPSSGWRKVNFPLTANKVTFEEGRFLVVKVVAHSTSEVDAWLAYGTATYNASLQLKVVATPMTTTTTTTPSTTSTTAGVVSTSTTSSTSPASTISSPKTTSSSLTEVSAANDSEAAEPPTAEGAAAEQESISLEPALFVAQSSNAATSADGQIDIFKPTVRELEPAEGLAVAFATMTENITLYWQAAIGTGGIASILLWIGLSRRENSEDGIDPQLNQLD